MSIDIHVPFVKLPKPSEASASDNEVRSDAASPISLSQNSVLASQIYDIVRAVREPQHPYTMEQLNMVQPADVEVTDNGTQTKFITVRWAPLSTVCRFANHIGLCIRVKIERELKDLENYKVDIILKDGSHKQKTLIDKQANDKERVQCAKENPVLMKYIYSLIDQASERPGLEVSRLSSSYVIRRSSNEMTPTHVNLGLWKAILQPMKREDSSQKFKKRSGLIF